MSDEQDMRKMGGIWTKIPTTYVLMWIGSIALAGLPFLSGYYSKDIILEAAFADDTWFGSFAFWMGIAAAFMTAFYSWRLILMTFHGKPRASKEVMDHIHESPSVMISPLVILATGAIFAGSFFYGGFVGSAHDPGHSKDLSNMSGTVNLWDKEHFWGDSIKVLPENDTVEAAHNVPYWVKKLPIATAAAGILLAYLFYMWREGMATRIAARIGPLYRLSLNKWYFDEIYDAVFVRNSWRLGRLFSTTGDKKLIDGLGPDGVAGVSVQAAGILSRFQSGYLFQYAFVMIIGVIAVVSWFAYKLMLGS